MAHLSTDRGVIYPHQLVGLAHPKDGKHGIPMIDSTWDKPSIAAYLKAWKLKQYQFPPDIRTVISNAIVRTLSETKLHISSLNFLIENPALPPSFYRINWEAFKAIRGVEAILLEPPKIGEESARKQTKRTSAKQKGLGMTLGPLVSSTSGGHDSLVPVKNLQGNKQARSKVRARTKDGGKSTIKECTTFCSKNNASQMAHQVPHHDVRQNPQQHVDLSKDLQWLDELFAPVTYGTNPPLFDDFDFDEVFNSNFTPESIDITTPANTTQAQAATALGLGPGGLEWYQTEDPPFTGAASQYDEVQWDDFNEFIMGGIDPKSLEIVASKAEDFTFALPERTAGFAFPDPTAGLDIPNPVASGLVMPESTASLVAPETLLSKPSPHEDLFERLRDPNNGLALRASLVDTQYERIRRHPDALTEVQDRRAKAFSGEALVSGDGPEPHLRYFAKALVIHFLEMRRDAATRLSRADVRRTLSCLVVGFVGHEAQFEAAIDVFVGRMLVDLDHVFDRLRHVFRSDTRVKPLMRLLLERADVLLTTQRDDEVDALGIVLALEEMLRIANHAPAARKRRVDDTGEHGAKRNRRA